MSKRGKESIVRDEETLGDFVDGRLDEVGRAQVQAWLAEDEAAFDAVVLARSLSDAEAALVGGAFPQGVRQRSAAERAKALLRPGALKAVFRLLQGALELVEPLVEGAWAPVEAPAMRGDQGGGGCDLWAGRTGLGRDALTVEVERTDGGAVIAAGAQRPEGAQLALLQAGSVIAVRPATVEPAELAEVTAGEFSVELRRSGSPVASAAVVLEAA